jgi:hypothetical protein
MCFYIKIFQSTEEMISRFLVQIALVFVFLFITREMTDGEQWGAITKISWKTNGYIGRYK